jgi:hypothetical protein
LSRRVIVASDMAVALPEGKITRETEKAVLYEYEDEKTWVPKSVIHEDSDIWKVGEEGVLKVQSWWASKNGHE